MSEQKLYSTLSIPGSFLVPGFCIYVKKLSEPEFMGFYDYLDSNAIKSYKSLNHKNQSSDFIELVNNG